MKLLNILILLCVAFGVNAQGIEFFKGTWEEALDKAVAEDKLIFVDAYAAWCGPCKRMAKNVFPQKKVGDFFNKNFVNLKLDVEKDKEGKKFRKKYPISAFPTLYFVDGRGKTVHRVTGAQQADQLIKLGKTAMSKVDDSGEFAKKYEDGDRDPELVYNYVKALNKAGKPSLKIANEYIKSQKDMTTPQNLKFLLEAASESDSRIFDMMIKQKSAITKIASEEAFLDKVEKACNKTAAKAIEFESTDLLEEAKMKMKANHPKKYEEFAYISEMKFHRSFRNVDEYCKACDTYVKKALKGNPQKMNMIAMEIMENFGSHKKAMKQAEKYAKKAAETEESAEYYFGYANILYKNGKQKAAIKAAERSRDLATNRRYKLQVEKFISKLQQG